MCVIVPHGQKSNHEQFQIRICRVREACENIVNWCSTTYLCLTSASWNGWFNIVPSNVPTRKSTRNIGKNEQLLKCWSPRNDIMVTLPIEYFNNLAKPLQENSHKTARISVQIEGSYFQIWGLRLIWCKLKGLLDAVLKIACF